MTDKFKNGARVMQSWNENGFTYVKFDGIPVTIEVGEDDRIMLYVWSRDGESRTYFEPTDDYMKPYIHTESVIAKTGEPNE